MREVIFRLPLDLPIHPRAERFVVIRAEAYIEYRGAMLKLLDQLPTNPLILCIIQVYILVPRRD